MKINYLMLNKKVKNYLDNGGVWEDLPLFTKTIYEEDRVKDYIEEVDNRIREGLERTWNDQLDRVWEGR